MINNSTVIPRWPRHQLWKTIFKSLGLFLCILFKLFCIALYLDPTNTEPARQPNYEAHFGLWAKKFAHHPPLIRSTRYSWFGVMSRYCTIEVMVGMADAFITAACFRLLMLASSGEKRESHESFNTWCNFVFLELHMQLLVAQYVYLLSGAQEIPSAWADCWSSRFPSPKAPGLYHLSTVCKNY